MHCNIPKKMFRLCHNQWRGIDFSVLLLFFFFQWLFWLHCGQLVWSQFPDHGSRPGLAVKTPNLNHWLPRNCFYINNTSILASPGGSDGKKSACNAGDLGLIPGLGRSTGVQNDNPLQYVSLENSTG